MMKLWREIILPLCEAGAVRDILEIGAEYGTSTHLLVQYARARGGHLHSIDPSPQFQADEFAAHNREWLTFYQALSLDVIPRIPPVDAVMLDGDHNWFTVFNELKAIERRHCTDAKLLPLIFVHDIGWPYGRRDLYYNPETIPEDQRQPYARKGILPNKPELVDQGGMNSDLFNAIREGGPRNGVLTGVEDYLQTTAADWHFVTLPLYYGLGILAPAERLQRNSALREHLQHFTLDAPARKLLGLAEHLRCTDGIMLQAIHSQLERANSRIAYLESQLEANHTKG